MESGGEGSPPLLHSREGMKGMKQDKVFKTILWLGGIFFFLLLVLMFILIFKGSLLSINTFGWKFVTGKVWDPVSEKFGLLPFVLGTILTSFISLFISLPFSLSLALFLGVYYKEGFLNKFLGTTTDLLAGIPSVIYGFWGLYFLVPLIRKLEMKIGVPPYGVGILTASLVLAIMITPFISSISKEVIKMVPQDLIEAGFSLGATTWEVIKKIILPYCCSGIFAGILLGFGRAFGETMAVTMLIGNSNFMPKSIFSPANTMASVIANEFTEATRDVHLSALIQIGLWLFILSVVVNLIGSFIVRRFEVK